MRATNSIINKIKPSRAASYRLRDSGITAGWNELTARNLLLAGRSRKPGFGGIHGGERGLFTLPIFALIHQCCQIKKPKNIWKT